MPAFQQGGMCFYNTVAIIKEIGDVREGEGEREREIRLGWFWRNRPEKVGVLFDLIGMLWRTKLKY